MFSIVGTGVAIANTYRIVLRVNDLVLLSYDFEVIGGRLLPFRL